MEKTATYTVISPHPNRRVWVAWGAVGVSVVALVVACMAAAVVNEQSTRVTRVEERLMEMESHIEDILRLMIENNEYDNKEFEEYDEDGEKSDYVYYDYGDADKEDEITVRRVLRRKRQANSIANEVPDASSVPIFDQSYGVNLKTHRSPNGLKLYDSLLSTDDDDTQVEETTPESTESPIKPHHRVSNLWVPKKRRPRLPTSSGPPTLSARTLVRQIDSANGREDNELAEIFPGTPASQRHSRYTERRSRTKILSGTRSGLKSRQKKQRERPNSTSSVVYRPWLVKSTSRHDSGTTSNNVVPKETLPEVVPQDQSRRTPLAFSTSPSSSFYNKKRRSKNKQHRRRRRARPVLTVAHFGASPRNSTHRPSLPGTGDHLDWNPAPWMNKLGLNTKYSMNQGTVTVREAGLYYIYAQVLYESGRANGGFQILVDNIPILECLAPALRPAPTCLTGGISYLPRNAEVKVRDLDNYLRTIHVPRNTFFGLIKLMDARNTAEEMLLA